MAEAESRMAAQTLGRVAIGLRSFVRNNIRLVIADIDDTLVTQDKVLILVGKTS